MGWLLRRNNNVVFILISVGLLLVLPFLEETEGRISSRRRHRYYSPESTSDSDDYSSESSSISDEPESDSYEDDLSSSREEDEEESSYEDEEESIIGRGMEKGAETTTQKPKGEDEEDLSPDQPAEGSELVGDSDEEDVSLPLTPAQAVAVLIGGIEEDIDDNSTASTASPHISGRAFERAREDSEESDEAQIGIGGRGMKKKKNTDKPKITGKCGGTYNLETNGTIIIKGGTDKDCSYTALGSPNCIPAINCKSVTLKGDPAQCNETYLEIADGWGGNHKVCGDEKLPKNGARASYGARDLFVNVKGHPGGKVDCTLQCHKGPALPDFLTKTKKKKIDERCVCGLQNSEDRIVGGEDSAKFEFPWQAAIVEYGTRTPICGASLINDRWILTASHCFYFSNTTAKEVQVLLHAHLLDMAKGENANETAALGEEGSIQGRGWNDTTATDEDERTIRLDISEVILHPFFNDDYDFDVALLRIAKPLDLTTIEATPVCLPKVGDSRDFAGTQATVVGWGKANELAGATTRLLQKLNVPIIASEECGKWMNIEIPPRSICAGFQQGVQDACSGDSGGPLISKQSSGQYMQIGIVSWGEGCARANRPGVYSRVTDLSDWIQFNIRRSSSPVWCRENE